jgi:hypothetical protein
MKDIEGSNVETAMMMAHARNERCAPNKENH